MLKKERIENDSKQFFKKNHETRKQVPETPNLAFELGLLVPSSTWQPRIPRGKGVEVKTGSALGGQAGPRPRVCPGHPLLPTPVTPPLIQSFLPPPSQWRSIGLCCFLSLLLPLSATAHLSHSFSAISVDAAVEVCDGSAEGYSLCA